MKLENVEKRWKNLEENADRHHDAETTLKNVEKNVEAQAGETQHAETTLKKNIGNHNFAIFGITSWFWY